MNCLLAPWPHSDWNSTVAASEGWTWMWMDLNGTTTAKVLPDQPILTSWLWGWRPSAWARLRIDGTNVIGSSLRATTESDVGNLPGVLVEVASITIPRIAALTSDERQNGSTPMITLREVSLPTLTFLELPDSQ